MAIIRGKLKIFDTKCSPIVIKANEIKGNADITDDWRRGLEHIYIDGKPLPAIYTEQGYKYLPVPGKSPEKNEELMQFFSDILLKNLLISKNDEEKVRIEQEIKEYLFESFHQGGLMYPVSAALYEILSKTMEAAFSRFNDTFSNIVHITTTSTGFLVQEFVEIKALSLFNENNEIGEPAMLFPQERNYVIQAEGTIKVDFSNFKACLSPPETKLKPVISVESNMISYGNSEVRRKMDGRSLLQIIADFLRNFFKMNTNTAIILVKDETEKSIHLNVSEEANNQNGISSESPLTTAATEKLNLEEEQKNLNQEQEAQEKATFPSAESHEPESQNKLERKAENNYKIFPPPHYTNFPFIFASSRAHLITKVKGFYQSANDATPKMIIKPPLP